MSAHGLCLRPPKNRKTILGVAYVHYIEKEKFDYIFTKMFFSSNPGSISYYTQSSLNEQKMRQKSSRHSVEATPTLFMSVGVLYTISLNPCMMKTILKG